MSDHIDELVVADEIEDGQESGEKIASLKSQYDSTYARIQRLDAFKQLAGIPALCLSILVVGYFLTFFLSTDLVPTYVKAFIVGGIKVDGQDPPLWYVILRAWSFVIIPLLATYIVLIEWPIRKLKLSLTDIGTRWRLARMSNKHEFRHYLREELDALTIETPQLLFDNDQRYKKANEFHEKARKILDKEEPTRLGEAQSYISSIKIITLRVQRERTDQRNWNHYAIATITVYVITVAVLFYLTYVSPLANDVTFPIRIFFWSATGSLATTLYRFYTVKGQISIGRELRWLIARPAIGIIMGGLAYLVYDTGLLVVFEQQNTVTEQEIHTAITQSNITNIVVFLAAFSDRFYQGLVTLLLDHTMGRDSKAEGTAPGADAAESSITLPEPNLQPDPQPSA